MKLLKNILVLILVAVLITGISGCADRKPKEDTKYTGVYFLELQKDTAIITDTDLKIDAKIWNIFSISEEELLSLKEGDTISISNPVGSGYEYDDLKISSIKPMESIQPEEPSNTVYQSDGKNLFYIINNDEIIYFYGN